MQIISALPGTLIRITKKAAFPGILLIVVATVAMIWANSPAGAAYFELWQNKITIGFGDAILSKPLLIWINDGLMALFFFVIGLEIKREIIAGELSTWKKAAMPVYAALGGMIIPSVILIFFNHGKTSSNGWGIPIATDIAFSLGILALLGKRVPLSLKIFLTALAIVDDLGAIIIIAVFYTETFSLLYFGVAIGIFGLLLVLNRLKVHNLLFYLLPGVVMWYCMLQSGVHATVSGVLLAFALPFANGDESSPSYKLQHFLHKPVAFIILPIFALANTGIVFTTGWYNHLTSKNSLGILWGLIAGKPPGILLFTVAAVKLKISNLAEEMTWKHIIGAGLLGGIGFTMSIFISLLAFNDGQQITDSKIAVLFASFFAGIIGFIYLRVSIRNKKEHSGIFHIH